MHKEEKWKLIKSVLLLQLGETQFNRGCLVHRKGEVNRIKTTSKEKDQHQNLDLQVTNWHSLTRQKVSPTEWVVQP